MAHYWIPSGILVVSLLFLAGCDVQYRMLYYPTPSIPSKQSVAEAGVRFWPSYGEDYRGFIGGDETDDYVRGTVIVFHGNGGIAADRGFYAKILGSLGYRVVLAEYPMYGGRKGKLGETAFVRDADETVRLAFESFGGPVYLLGESLGCGVVCAVVRDTKIPIKGIMLITPWDTLGSVAKAHYPLLPQWLFLKDSYDNMDNLSRFKGRIAIVGASQDEIIPISHARNLYQSLKSHDVKMWEIAGAGHNNWLSMVDMPWWEDVIAFVGKP